MEDTREGMKKDKGIKGLNLNYKITVPLTFYLGLKENFTDYR